MESDHAVLFVLSACWALPEPGLVLPGSAIWSDLLARAQDTPNAADTHRPDLRHVPVSRRAAVQARPWAPPCRHGWRSAAAPRV